MAHSIYPLNQYVNLCQEFRFIPITTIKKHRYETYNVSVDTCLPTERDRQFDFGKLNNLKFL